MVFLIKKLVEENSEKSLEINRSEFSGNGVKLFIVKYKLWSLQLSFIIDSQVHESFAVSRVQSTRSIP